MTQTFAGHYPLENRAGEIERLRIQAEGMAPDTLTMLDRIGVKPGWRCLDIGCGPGGITRLLSERVGPGGRVVGLDMDEQHLAHARASAPANVEFAAAMPTAAICRRHRSISSICASWRAPPAIPNGCCARRCG